MEENTAFYGYCVYIQEIESYAQIVGVMNDSEDYEEFVPVSFNENLNQAIVYYNENFFPILYIKTGKHFKLGEALIEGESLYKLFIDREKIVNYNNQEINYYLLTKSIKLIDVPDGMKEKYFLYEINDLCEFSFLTYSNPLDVSILRNRQPDLNITTISPDPATALSKICEFLFELTPGSEYQINSSIEYSRIVDNNGNVLSYFDSYKNGENIVIIYFKNVVSEDCSIFIPDGALSIKTINTSKSDPEGVEGEEYQILHFLTDYTYTEEPQIEPEIPDSIVVNGVVYHRVCPNQPLRDYTLHTVVQNGVVYYAWILDAREEPELDYYTLPMANSPIDTTFNGLFKYYKDTDVVNDSRRRTNDVVFINKKSINRLSIKPQLRTGAHFVGEETSRDILFESGTIKVVLTAEVINLDGVGTSIYSIIDYNREHVISLGDKRCIKLTIEFYIDDIYHLEKTVQFYNLPNNLYNSLINSNIIDQSNYNSLIDILTGEPAVVKYGCLLLTGHDVILSVETEELDENDLPITKLVAELVPTTKVRMGNLNGIYNETFGKNQPRGFGLYGESVYLTGNFYLNNGKSLVDINNDVTVAVGNINGILSTLENLSSNFLNSIYNLTVSLQEMATALTASFNLIISNNNDAIFRLGKDYSIWSLGNAGISLINPNATYTEDGDINDSTIGDGDEYVLLLGESIQISTNVIKNNRLKVIVCNIDPQSFVYNHTTAGNEMLYQPTNTGIMFAVGWLEISTYLSGNKCLVLPNEESKTGSIDENSDNAISSQNARSYYRYVSLEKTVNIDTTNGFDGPDTVDITPPGQSENYNIYSFSISRKIHGSDIYKTYSGNDKFIDLSLQPEDLFYYIIPDILIAGLFRDGKFNADYIETENVIAFKRSDEYKRNPEFDITQPITSSGDNPNFPVLRTSNNQPAKEAPFAVISGSTGLITALGMQMKKAIVGDVNDKNIIITDNTGDPIYPDYNNSYNGNSVVAESEPSIYLRDGSEIVAEFSSKKGKLLEKFFKSTTETLVLGTNNANFSLGNNDTITYNRNLTIANATSRAGYGWLNKTQLLSNGSAKLYNGSNNGYVTSYQEDKFYATVTEQNFSIGYDTTGGRPSLINSDIGQIKYATNSNATSAVYTHDIKNGIELEKGKMYEISGNLIALFNDFPNLITYIKKSINNNSYIENNDSRTTFGLDNHVLGKFQIFLSIALYNGDDEFKNLKTIYYQIASSPVYETKHIAWTDSVYGHNLANENDMATWTDNVIDSDYLTITGMRTTTYNLFSSGNTDPIRFSYILKPSSTYSNLTLRATLRVKMDINDLMSKNIFVKINSGNNNPHDPNVDPNPIGDPTEHQLYSGDTGAYSEVTPNNSRYYWHPLMSPDSYIVKPTVNISGLSVNLTTVKERTAILGNGFLTGYSEDNKFEISFIDRSNNILFRRSEFISGVGLVSTNTGIYNAFRLNGSEYTINKIIPILYGSFKPTMSAIGVRNSNGNLLPESLGLYSSYDFSGYSVCSASSINSELGVFNWYYISSNIFKNIPGVSINRNGKYGCLHYIPTYDIYICTGFATGQVVVLFGSNWDKLFSKYGRNIIVSLTPKYYNSSYPIVVNNSNILQAVDLEYNKINGFTVSGNDYTLNFGNTITKTDRFGFEVDCWALSMYTGNSYTSLNSIPGYFDVIVNYIPILT